LEQESIEVLMLNLRYRHRLKNKRESKREQDSKDLNRLNRLLNLFQDSLMIVVNLFQDSLMKNLNLFQDSLMKIKKNKIMILRKVDSISVLNDYKDSIIIFSLFLFINDYFFKRIAFIIIY